MNTKYKLLAGIASVALLGAALVPSMAQAAGERTPADLIDPIIYPNGVVVPNPNPNGTNPNPDPVPDTPAAQAEAKILALMNADRARAGLAPLVRVAAGDTVARGWSEYMLSSGDFRHNPDYFNQIPQDWFSAGENIAYHAGFDDPGAKLYDQWWNSPGHKENMMSPKFSKIGIGVACHAGKCYGTQDMWG